MLALLTRKHCILLSIAYLHAILLVLQKNGLAVTKQGLPALQCDDFDVWMLLLCMLVFSSLQEQAHHMQHSSLTVSASVLLWPLPILPGAYPNGPTRQFGCGKRAMSLCPAAEYSGLMHLQGCKLSYAVEHLSPFSKSSL